MNDANCAHTNWSLQQLSRCFWKLITFFPVWHRNLSLYEKFQATWCNAFRCISKACKFSFFIPQIIFRQNIQLWVRNCQVINFNNISPQFIRLDYNGRDAINISLLLNPSSTAQDQGTHFSWKHDAQKLKTIGHFLHLLWCPDFGQFCFLICSLASDKAVDCKCRLMNDLLQYFEFLERILHLRRNPSNCISLCTLLSC